MNQSDNDTNPNAKGTKDNNSTRPPELDDFCETIQISAADRALGDFRMPVVKPVTRYGPGGRSKRF